MPRRGKRTDVDESAIAALDWFAVRATSARRRTTHRVRPLSGSVSADWGFRAELQLRGRGFATFLPTKGVYRFANRYAVARRVKDERPTPIYPGWLFVGIEPGANRWRELLDTPGVYGIVGSDGRPMRIPAARIAQLFGEYGLSARAEDRERFMRSRKEYAAGDSVRVLGGPFDGSVCKVSTIRGRDAEVILSLLGADRAVKVDAMMLEAA